MQRILCIWLPNWPIQRLVAVRPELNGRAVVLHAHDARRGQCVAACSAAAQTHGARVGMPLVEATALLERSRVEGGELRGRSSAVRGSPDSAHGRSPRAVRGSPDPAHTLDRRSPLDKGDLSVGRLGGVGRPAPSAAPSAPSAAPNNETGFHIEAHDPQADREALLQLAEWCERFSPIVGLESAEQPASLFLDVTGLGPLFGGEAALAETVTVEFQQRGYVVRVAIADTIGAAWAVARFAEQRMKDEGEEERNVAEVARLQIPPRQLNSCEFSYEYSVLSTQYSVPFPLAVVPPDENLAALYPLPVEALRLHDSTVDLLYQLGVFQIEQLLRLPRAGLLSRFGEELLRRVDQASGAVKELIVAHRPPPEFQAQWLLEHPTDRRETVEYIVEQLVDRVAAMLAQHDRGAVQVECRLDCTLECGDESPTLSS